MPVGNKQTIFDSVWLLRIIPSAYVVLFLCGDVHICELPSE